MGEEAQLKGVLSSRLESAASFIEMHSQIPIKQHLIICKNAAAIADDDSIGFILSTTPPNARKEFKQHLLFNSNLNELA